MKSPRLNVERLSNPFWNFKKSSSMNQNFEFDKFYIYSAKKKVFKEVFLAQMKSLIVKKKEKLDGYLIADVSDYVISIIESDFIGHGIQFTKQSFQFQFFGKNILDWFDDLKKYCFQLDFNSKYELLNLVSRGSVYKVYDAINIFESTNYTVKLYEKSLLSSHDAIHKEITIFRLMDHPGIVNLIEVFENDQGYMLVYEKSEGGTLSDVIKKYQIPEQQSLKIIFRLLNSLDYIHGRNVLHRNIKPENIMVKNLLQPENVKIGDFSLADFFRRDGKYMFTRCGTPGYVAPEILQDKGYDFTVDVYSLGVIFYMLLSGGTSPFPTNNYDERIYLNYLGDIDYSIINCSCDSMDLLQKMLELSPQKRLTSSKAIWHHAFRGLHKLRITSCEPGKRNSTIKLAFKQALPPKIVENLKVITCPQFQQYQLPQSSARYHRRQKFRFTYKSKQGMSTASSPILSPSRNLQIVKSQKEIKSLFNEK